LTAVTSCRDFAFDWRRFSGRPRSELVFATEQAHLLRTWIFRYSNWFAAIDHARVV
jgi:hypothetical protein